MDILLQHITGTSYRQPYITYSHDKKLAMTDGKDKLILVDFDKLTNYSDTTVIGLTRYTLLSTYMDISKLTNSNKTESTFPLSILPYFHTITNSIRDTILSRTNSNIKRMSFLNNNEQLKLKESVLLVLDTSGRITIIQESSKNITKHGTFLSSAIDLRATLAIRFIEETVVNWYEILGQSTMEINEKREHVLTFKLVVLNRVNCIILMDVAFNMDTMETSSREIFRGCIQNKFIIVDTVESGGEIVFVLFCHETKMLMFYAERSSNFVGLGSIGLKQYLAEEPVLYDSIKVIDMDNHTGKMIIMLRGQSSMCILKGIFINKSQGNMISIDGFDITMLCPVGEVVFVGYCINEGQDRCCGVYYVNHKLDIVADGNCGLNEEYLMVKAGVDRLKVKVGSLFDRWKVEMINVDIRKRCIYSVVKSNKELFVIMGSINDEKDESGRFFRHTYLENEVVIKKDLSDNIGKKICMNCLQIGNEVVGFDIMKEKCAECKIGELYYI